jgi:hypothetical protein
MSSNKSGGDKKYKRTRKGTKKIKGTRRRN